MTNTLTNAAEKLTPHISTDNREFITENRIIWRLGAGVGLLGGLLILFAGIFLLIFEYFGNERLHTTWLFAAVLPLWFLGAHCFDKIDAAEKAGKIDRCEKLAPIE